MDTAHPLFGTPTGPDGPVGPPKCSAKGCRDLARWSLLWNNPTLHTPDRRKSWLACDTHRDSLSQFLAVRGFLKETEPFPEPGAQPGAQPAAGPAGAPASE